MTSLIQLSREKRMPAHQYMDKETLAWIKSNRPTFHISKNIKRQVICDFIKNIKIHVSRIGQSCDPSRINISIRNTLRFLEEINNFKFNILTRDK